MTDESRFSQVSRSKMKGSQTWRFDSIAMRLNMTAKCARTCSSNVTGPHWSCWEPAQSQRCWGLVCTPTSLRMASSYFTLVLRVAVSKGNSNGAFSQRTGSARPPKNAQSVPPLKSAASPEVRNTAIPTGWKWIEVCNVEFRWFWFSSLPISLFSKFSSTSN